MKILLDVNVIMEYFAHRELYKEASMILKSAEQGMFKGFISAMAFDTLTYLIGNELKKQGIHEPEKRESIRGMLNKLLAYISVVDITQDYLGKGLNDESFKDLEDAYQYYCAKENDCDGIITINTKDFLGEHAEKLPVYSLTDFVKNYIEE